MKITRVEAIPFSIPTRRPFGFSGGVVHAADHVLIRVHTDDGVLGQGEAAPRAVVYGETQASVVAIIRQWIEPAYLGLDPLRVEHLHARLRALAGNHTAKAAVDIAVHDIIGQVHGLSCSTLLGGFSDRLRVSHMLGFGTPEESAEEAARLRARYGIAAFKIKVGVGEEHDLATCAAVRAAVGPDALLYADANHGYRADDALRIVPRMAEWGIAWIEEPCGADDRLGRRRVAERIGVPVAGDESCRSLAEVTAEVTEGRCRMVSVKTARTGFFVSGRIVAVCEALGATPVCGSQLEGSIGVLAQAAFGSAHEATAAFPAELTGFLAYADDIVTESPAIHNGELVVSGRSGLGLTIDEDKLTRYRCDEEGP
jgi:L-alanine-DL-glutamate epimerase-like enolase superfamily enzyme